MLADMRKLIIGEALSPASRAILLRWLDANTTGNERIRAGLPAGWIVGDKTGTGDNGTSNNIAIIRPPSPRAHLSLRLSNRFESDCITAQSAAIASVAKTVAAWAQV